MKCSWLLGWRQAAELCSKRWEQPQLPTFCSCNREPIFVYQNNNHQFIT